MGYEYNKINQTCKKWWQAIRGHPVRALLVLLVLVSLTIGQSFFSAIGDQLARPKPSLKGTKNRQIAHIAFENTKPSKQAVAEGVSIADLGAGRDIRIEINTIIQEQVPPLAGRPSRTENRIFLYERYGGEWHTSNDEPILFASDQAFLRNEFVAGRKYRFTPTIHNGSEMVTLANPVQLYINLPTELQVVRPKLWVISGADSGSTQYVARVPDAIPPRTGGTLNESLFIVFPKPGRYFATYSIHGTTSKGEGFSTERRTLYFELTGGPGA